MDEREAWEKHLEQIANLNARDQVRAAGEPYFRAGYRQGREDTLEEAEAIARAPGSTQWVLDRVRALRREREGSPLASEPDFCDVPNAPKDVGAHGGEPSHIEAQTAVSPEAIDEQLASRNRKLIDEVYQAEAQGIPVRRPTPEEDGDG